MSNNKLYRAKNFIISEVSAKSCANVVHVELSPVELTPKQRNAILTNSNELKKIQHLKRPMPINLVLKIVGFERTLPLQRSEAFVFVANGTGLGFHGGTQSGIVDINEPLEIVFHLNIPPECWSTVKGTRVTWWKDGDVINDKDFKGRIKQMTEQVPKDGTLSLLIDTCKPEDSGFYQVKVMSEKGNILTSNHKQIAVIYERPNFVKPLPRVIDIDLLKRLMCGDKVDASVTLSCECAGKPEVSVSWYLAPKGRKTVPVYSSDNYKISLNSGVAKLYIKNIFAELGDWISSDGELEPIFICRAETSLGYVETSTALVIKKFPPMFATKAENLSVRLGDKTSIICRGIGWPTPKLRWILNGVTVGQKYKDVRVIDVENVCPDLFETAQMLQISKVTSNLGGTLKVVAINELGSDLQELLVSIAPEKPAFIEQLSDLRVKEGKPLLLRTRIIGHPLPKVNWLRNGKHLEKFVRISDFETTVDGECYALHLSNVSKKLTGKFSCKAANSVGVAISSAEVIVLDGHNIEDESDVHDFQPPTFTRELEETYSSVEGNKVILECHVTGFPQPEVKWLKCGKELLEDDSKYTNLEADIEGGTTVSSLIFEKPVEIDSGEYEVVAENLLGKASTATRLVITGKDVIPVVVDKKFDEHVYARESCTFLIVVECGPNTEANWFKKGEEIIGEGRFHPAKKLLKLDGRVQFELRIDDVQLDDEGTYGFRAANKSGNVSAEGSLKVTDRRAPSFRKKLLVVMSRREGKRVSFGCIACGHPELCFRWYMNGNPVFHGDRITISSKEMHSSKPSAGSIEIKQVLTVNKVLLSDSGKVKVELSNEFGSSSCECNFSVTRASLPTPVEIVPPLILEDMTNKVVELHEACCFTVLARGRPTPEIQWFRNEVLVESSERIQIAAAEGIYSLIIKYVVEEDSAVYRATLSNEGGEQSTCAQLFLKNTFGPNEQIVEPKFENLLRDKSLQAGEDCLFSVSVSGLKLTSIVWSKDGHPLDKKNSRFQFEDDYFHGTHQLRINKVVLSDAGRYAIKIANKKGRKMSSATLKVREMKTMIVSERILLKDDVQGETIMELLCFRKARGSDISGENLKRRWIVEKAYFAKDHEGRLLCEKWQASSTSDYIFSGDQDATYLRPDEFVFVKQSVNLIVNMREACKEALWLKDGNIISVDPDDYDDDPKYETSSSSNGLQYVLAINDVCDEDEGIYTFKVLW